jgi:hypothetical protein
MAGGGVNLVLIVAAYSSAISSPFNNEAAISVFATSTPQQRSVLLARVHRALFARRRTRHAEDCSGRRNHRWRCVTADVVEVNEAGRVNLDENAGCLVGRSAPQQHPCSDRLAISEFLIDGALEGKVKDLASFHRPRETQYLSVGFQEVPHLLIRKHALCSERCSRNPVGLPGYGMIHLQIFCQHLGGPLFVFPKIASGSGAGA